MEDILECTRCKKKLTEFKINIEFHICVNRMRPDEKWEYIPNLDELSREVVCVDCFNEFSELMSALNIKYTGEK